jgi:hypothetical protein
VRDVTTRRPVFRVGVTDCHVDKEFVNNRDFTPISGGEFFFDGIPHFPVSTAEEKIWEKQDGSYYTCFMGASHNGVTYGRSDRNIACAFSRMSGIRKPSEPGLHHILLTKQSNFITDHEAILNDVFSMYASGFASYTNAIEECEDHHADPHGKRDLRINTWAELLDLGEIGQHLWFRRGTYVNYKMKIFEIAKPDKPPRMIGDLGVAASLQGFRITAFVKYAMADNDIHINGGTLSFCVKPNPFELERHFKNLMDPPGRFYFVYFSDDSCLSIRREDGGVDMYNIDISTCDASHGPDMFTLIERTVPSLHRGDMEALVDQCRAPIEIRSVANPKNKIVLKSQNPHLYSGSTLTTIINNQANILIGIAISEMVYTGDLHHRKQLIMDAAARCGYPVTCDHCPSYSMLQFLKHSPVYGTDGKIHPLLNLGVLVRLAGSCKGDLPGRGDLNARAIAMQSSLLQGAYPRTECALLTTMRSHAGAPTVKSDAAASRLFEYRLSNAETYPTFTVSSDELYRRYSLDDADIYWMDHVYANLRVGDFLNCNALDQILLKDYGLQCQELPDNPVDTR